MNVQVVTSKSGRVTVHWTQWEAWRISAWDSVWLLIPIGALIYYLTSWTHAAIGPAVGGAFPFIFVGSFLVVGLAAGFILQIKPVRAHQDHGLFRYIVACTAFSTGDFYVIRIRVTAYTMAAERILSAFFSYEHKGWDEGGILSYLSGTNPSPVILRASEIQGFSLNTSQFHAIGSGTGHPVEQIILADLGEGASQTVCVHYGSQSEVAQLRSILQREFITKRPRPTVAKVLDADDPI